MGTRIIKCPNCGTFNKNIDYCTNCNTLISHQKKRELKEEEVKQEQVNEAIYKLEHPNLAERLKKHPNFIYKTTGYILYSAITIVSLIGGALAWFIAMVSAG
jgi:uncharacterized C2H2 Zn-finger protein